MDQDIKINQNIQSDVHKVISEPTYVQLSENVQKSIITTLREARQEEGGIMGKLFGTNKDNASIHCAFVICVLMLVVGIVCMILGENYWNVIFPAVTSAIGFIFGKGNK